MAANNRIYFAIQQVGLKPNGDTGSFNALHGVQDVSITTNFNLNQIFTMGQLEIYANLEDIPDVEVTMSKVLDGYPLIWHRATQSAVSPTLAGRSNARAIFGMAVFPDTNDSAAGTPPSIVECSGMYPSSVSYSFSTDGEFTESVTLVGNDKIWYNDPKITNTESLARSAALTFAGAFGSNNDSPIGVGGVNRREHLDFDYTATTTDTNGMVADSDCTILPPDIYGISDSGTNELTEGVRGAHINSITVSADLGRESINELGRRGPYHRFVTFPIEVTCEIEVTSSSGDLISATENGVYGNSTGCTSNTNLLNRTIRLATCEGTRIYLGTKNKLSSVSQSGGDTGGGNVTVSYSYSTFNDFTVLHSGDPNTSGANWWTERDNYLLN